MNEQTLEDDPKMKKPFQKDTPVAIETSGLLTNLFTNKESVLVQLDAKQVVQLPEQERKIYGMLAEAKAHFGDAKFLNPFRPQIEAQLKLLDPNAALNKLKEFIIVPPKLPIVAR